MQLLRKCLMIEKRKGTTQAKENQRKSKYSIKKHNSIQAQKAYSHHECGIVPPQVEDVLPKIL